MLTGSQERLPRSYAGLAWYKNKKDQGESSTRSLKAPLKVPLNAPLKVSLKALFKVRPPSCTPYCALEGAPLVTLPLALPRMGSWGLLKGRLKGYLKGSGGAPSMKKEDTKIAIATILRSYLSTPVFTFKWGKDLQQDLAILSQRGAVTPLADCGGKFAANNRPSSWFRGKYEPISTRRTEN